MQTLSVMGPNKSNNLVSLNLTVFTVIKIWVQIQSVIQVGMRPRQHSNLTSLDQVRNTLFHGIGPRERIISVLDPHQ